MLSKTTERRTYTHVTYGNMRSSALGTPQTPSKFCRRQNFLLSIRKEKLKGGFLALAIFHCSIKNISRSSGRSATSSAAYRSGTKVFDNELGKCFDYSRKKGIAFSEILLCENAPAEFSDREKLWNSVQEIEKQSNARLCREVEIALPVELLRDEQIRLAREYIQHNFTSKGMCADWALHDKGDGNPHVHILLTVRPIQANGKWGAKRKDRYALDGNGNKIPIIDPLTNKQKIGAGGRKMWERISVPTTDWNDQCKVEEWRESWANLCNKYLQGKAKVDHRSYARQGKKQLPTMHEGYVARKIAKSGKHSNIISYNQQVRQHNALEQANEQDIQTAENELKQLENELEKIKSEQKGQEQDGFNSIRRDFAELLERGKRTIDGVYGSTDNSQRGQRRDNQTAESGNQQPETTTQRTGTTDTDAIIKRAKAVSDSARATIANSTASRADREAEQQRQAVQRSSSNEKRSREDNESKRGTDESRPKTCPRR